MGSFCEDRAYGSQARHGFSRTTPACSPCVNANPRISSKMFRKPRIHASSSSVLGVTPSSPPSTAPLVEDETTVPHPDPILVESSPPSTKKQKLSHSSPVRSTPLKSTPGKPKQSLLSPYSIANSTKKPLSTSPFASSQSAGKGKSTKGNSSILSFFKPVTPGGDGKEAKSGKGGKLKGTQSDELFARHGEYDLDVSDPDDNEEEVEESGGWARGRSMTGELQLAKSEIDREELLSSPIAIKSRFSIFPEGAEGARDEVQRADGDMDVEVDEIESTAPHVAPVEAAATSEPVTPPRQLPTTSLKFNLASLNLDSSRSVLFSKRGATPSPFRKIKGARPRSSSSSSAEEIGFHEVDDEELGIPVEDRSNRDIGEFMAEKRPMTEKKGKGKAKRDRDEAFKQDSIELSSDIVIKKEKQEKVVDEIEEVISPKFEEELEDCTLESRPQNRKKGSAFLDDEFEDIDDFPDEEIGFEEQESYNFDPSGRAIEAGYEDFDGDFGAFGNSVKPDSIEDIEDGAPSSADDIKCPICAAEIGALSEQDANNHVNLCLDGGPIPLPIAPPKESPPKPNNALTSPFFGRVSVISPPTSSSKPRRPSAFAKLMSQNTESAAWASAAKAETDSRGKKAAERACPFYKILFNGSITVDAFRYGAVPGCKAYFLSHFHSDHYIGLTSKWDHGPIWCSRATANLVRKKLGVDPKWVKELPWEQWTTFEVEGVRVRGLDANHCPGSMLFLFENGRQRVLHCGDFRASPEHLKHPLLMPGKNGVKGQRLDTVYLDTTYLNPKYAFPSQSSVIDACSKLCVEMEKEASEGRASSVADKKQKGGVGSFVNTTNTGTGKKGKLLVVVGTYSIGKERVCLGIAKALNSKIFAPPNKMKICECLEDPELNARLTSNPKEAQVHMTPLMEIRAETLQEYLNTFKPSFDRIVGFRPSGWNYKPPNSRFTESPAVSTVLHSAGWRSEYTFDELVPQRGSTRESKCFGVPYSEHSSFRELSMFCCGLNIGKVIPTVKYALPLLFQHDE